MLVLRKFARDTSGMVGGSSGVVESRLAENRAHRPTAPGRPTLGGSPTSAGGLKNDLGADSKLGQ